MALDWTFTAVQESPWRLKLETEEVHRSTVGKAQNNLRKADSGSGKAGSGHFLPKGEDGRFCWLRTGHFLLCSEDVGKRDFPADPPRAATRFSNHRFYYNFTEITIPSSGETWSVLARGPGSG
jgi:hypothetical protein